MPARRLGARRATMQRARTMASACRVGTGSHAPTTRLKRRSGCRRNLRRATLDWQGRHSETFKQQVRGRSGDPHEDSWHSCAPAEAGQAAQATSAPPCPRLALDGAVWRLLSANSAARCGTRQEPARARRRLLALLRARPCPLLGPPLSPSSAASGVGRAGRAAPPIQSAAGHPIQPGLCMPRPRTVPQDMLIRG